jgi:hypothetical protein
MTAEPTSRKDRCTQADSRSRTGRDSTHRRARSDRSRRTSRSPDRSRGSSSEQIGPTRVVGYDDGFASAVFGLAAVEPVARSSIPVLDPDAGFSLAAACGQARASQIAGAYVWATLGHISRREAILPHFKNDTSTREPAGWRAAQGMGGPTRPTTRQPLRKRATSRGRPRACRRGPAVPVAARPDA